MKDEALQLEGCSSGSQAPRHATEEENRGIPASLFTALAKSTIMPLNLALGNVIFLMRCCFVVQ